MVKLVSHGILNQTGVAKRYVLDDKGVPCQVCHEAEGTLNHRCCEFQADWIGRLDRSCVLVASLLLVYLSKSCMGVRGNMTVKFCGSSGMLALPDGASW